MSSGLADRDVRPFPFSGDGLGVAPLVDLENVVGRILHLEPSPRSEKFGDFPDVRFPVGHSNDEKAGEDVIKRSRHYMIKSTN